MRVAGGHPKRVAALHRRIAEVLRSLSRACGLSVCLHDVTDFTRVGASERLSVELRTHQNPFCLAVKERAGKACVRDDLRNANRKAARLRTSFVKRCHAGVLELVTPVMLEGAHVGSLFLGPTADSGTRRARVPAKLPVRSRKELGEFAALAAVVADHLAQVGETMRMYEAQSAKRSEPVTRGIEFASRKYAEPVTVVDAARHACLSPSRFAHVFSEETGLPFHAYLTGVRIERAKRMLTRSTLRVSEVAAMTGFCNQNYFASVFRKHTQKTPTEYRRVHGEAVDA
jgi:AraC-like DNA-binding protein